MVPLYNCLGMSPSASQLTNVDQASHSPPDHQMGNRAVMQGALAHKSERSLHNHHRKSVQTTSAKCPSSTATIDNQLRTLLGRMHPLDDLISLYLTALKEHVPVCCVRKHIRAPVPVALSQHLAPKLRSTPPHPPQTRPSVNDFPSIVKLTKPTVATKMIIIAIPNKNLQT
eukprot:4332081-Amphidinium_carterae.1